jgi:hypothetical protein
VNERHCHSVKQAAQAKAASATNELLYLRSRCKQKIWK